MAGVGKRSLLVLTASLLLLLLGPVQAEAACEDMPCCRGDKATLSEGPPVADRCLDCRPHSCTCSIQSSNVDREKSNKIAGFNIRFEIESDEISITPLFAPPEPSPTGDWPQDPTDAALWPAKECLTYSLLPLPPPTR